MRVAYCTARPVYFRVRNGTTLKAADKVSRFLALELAARPQKAPLGHGWALVNATDQNGAGAEASDREPR
jgi:hypothetical protein